MDILFYNIEHPETAIYEDMPILLAPFLIVLSSIIIALLMFILFIAVLHLLVKWQKIKYISDTMLGIAFILSIIMTGFIIYTSTSTKNADENSYLIIWYENPMQKIEIQKSVLIDDMCLKIENEELGERTLTLPLPPSIHRKSIQITKDEEKKIYKAEEYFQNKIKEKYKDRLEIID